MEPKSSKLKVSEPSGLNKSERQNRSTSGAYPVKVNLYDLIVNGKSLAKYKVSPIFHYFVILTHLVLMNC